MDYQLIVPINTVKGKKIESVTVKDTYTGRDIKAIGNCKGEGDAMIELVVVATSLSENTVLNMDARDVKAIGELARPFLAGGEG